MDFERVSATVVVRRFRGRAAVGSNMGPGFAGRVRSVGNANTGSGSARKTGRTARAKRQAAVTREREVAALQRRAAWEARILRAIASLGFDREALTGTGRACRMARRKVGRVAKASA